MIAVNDNPTHESFDRGEEPEPSEATLDGAKFVYCGPWPMRAGWVVVDISQRGMALMAVLPHPSCPPWDGRPPAMSNRFRAPIAPKATEPTQLRVV